MKIFHFTDFRQILIKNKKYKEADVYIAFLDKITKILEKNLYKIGIKSCLVPAELKKGKQYNSNEKGSQKNTARRLIYAINFTNANEFSKNKFKIFSDNEAFSEYGNQNIKEVKYEETIKELNMKNKYVEGKQIEIVSTATKHPFFFIVDGLVGITKRANCDRNKKLTSKIDEINSQGFKKKYSSKMIDYGQKKSKKIKKYDKLW